MVLRLAARVDQFAHRLGLCEIELVVEVSAIGIFARLGWDSPRGYECANEGLHDVGRTMARDLGHIFARVRVWGREEGDDDLVEYVARHDPIPEKRTSWREFFMSALWNKELTDKGMRLTPRKTDKGYGSKVFAGGKGYDG